MSIWFHIIVVGIPIISIIVALIAIFCDKGDQYRGFGGDASKTLGDSFNTFFGE